MRIVLIGYRGAGKSTVARELATLLECDWVDADDEIEARAGKSIASIFADDGEGHFRDLETAVLRDLCARERIVLAAGGGAVLREENRDLLTAGGKIVWLRAAPETIIVRLRADAGTAARRPSLTGGGTEAEIAELLEQRTPIYRQCADVTVDTDPCAPAEVAAEILRQLKLDS